MNTLYNFICVFLDRVYYTLYIIWNLNGRHGLLVFNCFTRQRNAYSEVLSLCG
jgi:hypothetical protein